MYLKVMPLLSTVLVRAWLLLCAPLYAALQHLSEPARVVRITMATFLPFKIQSIQGSALQEPVLQAGSSNKRFSAATASLSDKGLLGLPACGTGLSRAEVFGRMPLGPGCNA